jgi:hypothetical protein
MSQVCLNLNISRDVECGFLKHLTHRSIIGTPTCSSVFDFEINVELTIHKLATLSLYILHFGDDKAREC